MKKIHKLSKIVAIVLVFATIASFTPAINAFADTVYLAKYIDKNFYGRSAPEPIYLDLEYDTLSMGARSEGNVPDQVTLHVIHAETNTCVFEHPFIADDHIETISLSLPTDRYKIYISGDPDIKKTDGVVVWGKEDNVIQFVWPW